MLHYLKLFETSPKLRDAVAGHVHDLMALALTQHAHLGESNLGAIATARLNEALDHIAAHFLDPALSLTKVAENMRISPRYVQRLLEVSGTVLYRASERAAPATRLHIAGAREQEPHL